MLFKHIIIIMLKVIVFLSVVFLIEAAHNPEFFKKCNKKDPHFNKCVTDSANHGWAAFVKGKNFHKIPVNTVTSIPNFVDANITGNIAGFENLVFNNIYINFAKRTVDVVYSQPLLSILVDYEMVGSLVGIDVTDKGFGNGTLVNGFYKYHFNYALEEKDAAHYVKIDKQTLTYNLDKLVMKVESKENKERGEVITTLFNNYWQLINILSDRYIGVIISEAYTPIVQEYFSSTSIQELFHE